MFVGLASLSHRSVGSKFLSCFIFNFIYFIFFFRDCLALSISGLSLLNCLSLQKMDTVPISKLIPFFTHYGISLRN